MESSENHKEQLLVVLSRFPYPLVKGDKLRAYHQLKELSKEFQVVLFCISDEEITDAHRKEVESICSELIIARITWFSKLTNMLIALLSGRPVQTGYFYSYSAKKRLNLLIKENSFKHIYCQLIRVSEYVKNIHHIPKTIDYMDALSSGVQKRIANQSIFRRWLFRMEAKRLTKYERRIFDYFEHHVIISEQDKQLIAHPDRNKIHVIPNGVDPQFLEELDRIDRYDLVFVGNMSYPPNIEAVSYINQYLLPKLPNATLLISGANPHRKVISIASANQQITLQGWTRDIRSAYLSGKIFLAPMMIGTGMQNKLLEAMALGTPCITTSLANNALDAIDGVEILVGDTADELISHAHSLLSNAERRKELSSNAKKLIVRRYNWESTCRPLLDLMKMKS